MSSIVTALATRNPKSTAVRRFEELELTFDELVATFSGDLVHYWKFQAPNTETDEQGLAIADITGFPQLNVPTLVLGDTLSEGADVDGTVIAWPGTAGEYAQALHNVAQKTGSGTVIVYFQCDTLNQKSQLIMGDATNAAGGFAFGVNTNGAPDAYLRGVGGTPVTIAGISGDVDLNRAYCLMFKWSGTGIELVLFDDAGVRLRRATNASATAGLSGTSAIRFGATHADTNHHDGPYGRVIWLSRSISAAEEALFGERTKTGLGGYRALEMSLTPLALWGMGDGTSASLLRDSAGTRNGTYVGQVTGASDLPAEMTEGAISFDGTGAGIVPHDTGLQLSTFTLSFWFRTNSMLQGDEPAFYRLLSKDSGTTNLAGDFWVLYHENGYLHVQFQDGTNNHAWISATGTVLLGIDHHVCIRASSTSVDVRLDGTTIAKTINPGILYTGAWAANTQPLRFAHSQDVAEGIADAVIDEVALYSRILTDSEVLALAQRSAVVPVAGNDAVDVPEGQPTPINVTAFAGTSFVGSKAALSVQIMSQPAGGDSVAVDSNNDIVYTAGNVTGDTVRSFTYRIIDANGTSNTATVSVTVINEVVPSTEDLPFFGQYYGGGLHSLSNGEFEMRSQPFTWFFRAERSGTIDRIRWHWRTNGDNSGYSDGEGGIYTLQVVTANPNTQQEATNSTVIAQCTGKASGNPTEGAQFPEFTFTQTGALVAGNPYCIKAINTHPQPASNYASMNATRIYHWYTRIDPPNFTEPGGGGAIGQIRVASGGVRGNAVGGAGGTPKIVRGYHPHMIDAATDYELYLLPTTAVGGNLRYDRLGGIHCSLRYTDGIWTGWGKGSGEYADSRLTIAGSTQARQRFRVTRANRTVSGVFILGWVTNGSGSLNVILEQGPQNDEHFPNNAAATVLETVSVPASMWLATGSNTFAYHQIKSGCDTCALDLIHYVWVPFNQNRPLTLGQTYNLRLAPVGACNFHMFGSHRDDDEYGVLGRNTATWAAWATNRRISWTAFEDSRGPQYSANGGSTWAYWPTGHQQIPITFKCA